MPTTNELAPRSAVFRIKIRVQQLPIKSTLIKVTDRLRVTFAFRHSNLIQFGP